MVAATLDPAAQQLLARNLERIRRMPLPTATLASEAVGLAHFVLQHPTLSRGDPGPTWIRWYEGLAPGQCIDLILVYDALGDLQAGLTHGPKPIADGNVGPARIEVAVSRRHRRQGVATALVRAAACRWELFAEGQEYTPAGVALVAHLKAEIRAGRLSA